MQVPVGVIQLIVKTLHDFLDLNLANYSAIGYSTLRVM